MFNLSILEIQRILTFGTIGVFNTLFDLAIWHSLVKYIKPDSSLEKFIFKLKLNKYSFSQGIAFVLSNIGSYFLNQTFTFSDSNTSASTRSFGVFFLVSFFSLSVSVLMMDILTKNARILALSQKLPKPLASRWALIAKLMVAPITLTTNFIGYRYFVF